MEEINNIEEVMRIIKGSLENSFELPENAIVSEYEILFPDIREIIIVKLKEGKYIDIAQILEMIGNFFLSIKSVDSSALASIVCSCLCFYKEFHREYAQILARYVYEKIKDHHQILENMEMRNNSYWIEGRIISNSILADLCMFFDTKKAFSMYEISENEYKKIAHDERNMMSACLINSQWYACAHLYYDEILDELFNFKFDCMHYTNDISEYISVKKTIFSKIIQQDDSKENSKID